MIYPRAIAGHDLQRSARDLIEGIGSYRRPFSGSLTACTDWTPSYERPSG